MRRHICIKCMAEFEPEKNGIYVEVGGGIWEADLWRCPNCSHRIITGFGNRPIAENWQQGYDAKLASTRKYGLYSLDSETPSQGIPEAV